MKTRYVALLRGINVGGKNVIRMKELKSLFEHCGFSDVETYIQSGNVMFSQGVARVPSDGRPELEYNPKMHELLRCNQ
ncbi:MAG: DUF1697 domain-containing protein [Bacteroidales bacterium]|jgi:uncharacterized protein (DUF1697 family)|nr:DUF1697 domain-containing protein [Bacteroidales bacterium]